MGENFAKFMATTDKKIVFGDKDVELKLTIPHKVAQQNLEFLTSSLNKEIHVILGDPQMAFDFDDEDDMYKPYTGGRRVVADASGVVTSIQQPEEQKDKNQAELFTEEAAAEGDASQSEEQTDNPAGDPPAGDDELNDYEKEIMGEGDADAGSDLPEWMQEASGGDSSADTPEMNFESEGGAESQDDQVENQGVDGEQNANIEIDKSAVEEYILEHRPSFPDLPLDFPDLFDKRRNQGLTWGNIAKDIGMTTGQLNAKLTKYRDAVKKQMIDGGVA